MARSKIDRFNLRVYGILIQEGEVLITDEHRAGIRMTKFPGGGLEFGEGLSDCLRREFLEELRLSVKVGELFYTNEFLQISRFKNTDQLHSFYFMVQPAQKLILEDTPALMDLNEGEQGFRWIKTSDLHPNDFTFPIDQIVAEKLRLA